MFFRQDSLNCASFQFSVWVESAVASFCVETETGKEKLAIGCCHFFLVKLIKLNIQARQNIIEEINSSSHARNQNCQTRLTFHTSPSRKSS